MKVFNSNVETDEKLRGKHLANFLRRMPVSGVVEPMEKDNR